MVREVLAGEEKLGGVQARIYCVVVVMDEGLGFLLKKGWAYRGVEVELSFACWGRRGTCRNPAVFQGRRTFYIDI